MYSTDSKPATHCHTPKARLRAAVSALYPRAKKIKVTEGSFGFLWIRVRVCIDGVSARACVNGHTVHAALTHLIDEVNARPELRRALLS